MEYSLSEIEVGVLASSIGEMASLFAIASSAGPPSVAPDGVVATATGELTVRELRDLRTRMMADPRLGCCDRYLVDLRQVEKFSLRGADLRQFAGEKDVFTCSPSTARVAILCESDEAFGLARMYELSRLSANDQLRIFRCVDQASRWLREATFQE